MSERQPSEPHGSMLAVAVVICLTALVMLALLVFFAPEHVGDVGPWVLGAMALLGLGMGMVMRNHPPQGPDDRGR